MVDTRTLDPTEIDNIIQDIRSYNFMMNMALSRFKHKTNIKELQDHDWYNEINLAYSGMLGLFHDDELDKFILLRCAPLGRPNFYGTYSQYICTAMNGKTFRVKADDIVILYDNIDRKPVTASDIIDTSNRIADAHRVCDSRMFRHKNPLLLVGNKKLVASYNKFIRKIDENYKAIMLENGDDIMDGIKTSLLTDINFINNDILLYSEKLIQECLGRLGINYNPASEKKERLVVDEVNSNNQQILLARAAFLDERKDFCKRAMERFQDYGLEYSIEYNDITNESESEGYQYVETLYK